MRANAAGSAWKITLLAGYSWCAAQSSACAGTASSQADSSGVATATCQSQTQTYFGTSLCLIKMADVPASDPVQFPAEAAFQDYYGYIDLQNYGSIQINDATVIDHVKGLIGVKDNSSILISIEIDRLSKGKSTAIATVPIYGYSVQNGNLQSGAALSLHSGIITPSSPFKAPTTLSYIIRRPSTTISI